MFASAGGWLLGFVLLVILAELWHVTGSEAEFPVGIGMGAGVGFLQSRIVGTVVDYPRRWLWSSIAGMGIPFLVWDVSTWAGVRIFYSLQLYAFLGAILVGILQAVLLRQRSERAVWWIPACAVGWGIPAGLAALQNVGILPVVGIVFGGLILGAVTGIPLTWISRQQRSVTAA